MRRERLCESSVTPGSVRVTALRAGTVNVSGDVSAPPVTVTDTGASLLLPTATAK